MGSYDVILTAIRCGVESQITLEVVVGDVGISANQKSMFRVFPNPSNGTVNLETFDNENKIYVFNLLGEIQKEINPTELKLSINLPSGLYLIKQGTSTQKVKVD